MAQFGIILNQIGVFAILLLIGVLLRKTKILNEGSLLTLSQITLKVSLPAFIFFSTVHGTTIEDYKMAFPAVIFILIFYIVVILISRILTLVFHLKGNTNRTYRLCMLFGNVGLVGVPVATELFPDTAMIYIAVVTIIDMLLMWTYGVNLSYDVESTEIKKRGFDKERLKSILLNPPLLAIFVSLIFVFGNLSLPSFIDTALEKIAGLMSPLGMIYIGGMLSWQDIRSALKRPEIYAHILFKMVILPVLAYVCLRAAGMPSDMCGTMTIICGVPVFFAALMLTKNNGSDHRLASGMVMLSTIAFLITYPAVSLIIETL